MLIGKQAPVLIDSPNQFDFGAAYAHNDHESKPGYGGELTAPQGGLMPAPPPAMGSHPPLGALGGPHTTPTYHGYPSGLGVCSTMARHTPE